MIYLLKRLIKKIFITIFGSSGVRFLQNSHINLDNFHDRLISNPDSIFAVHLQRKLPKKFKIGMAVLIHERPEYLELCLDSLFGTNLYNYDITFLLIDDGSTDARIRQLIEKPRNGVYKIHRCFSEKGHNSWGAAFNRAMKKLMEIDNFDILGSCDSDALFHPDWLDKTMKVCIWAKENDHNHILGAFSSFNSSDYAFHQIIDTCETPYGKYVVKKRMGALNIFHFTRDLKRIGFFAEDKNDETIMTEKLMKLRIRNFSLDQSYVEHTGKESVLNKWRPTAVTNPVYGMNMPSAGWPSNLETADTLGYYRYVKQSESWGSSFKSDVKLNIMIPVIEKDLQMLPYSLQGLRENLRHPLGKIFIVSPEKGIYKTFCKENDCFYLPEDQILEIKKKDIHYIWKGIDRSGWMLQQLIKLSVDQISDAPFTYVIDADTILSSPQIIVSNNKAVLLHSDEHHQPYFDNIAKIFGFYPLSPLSFVSHQMVFSINHLIKMKNEIETKHSKKWFEVILGYIDINEQSCFSEYETYGHWMLINYPEEITREYWFNCQVFSQQENKLDFEMQKYKQYRSISHHTYIY